MLAHRTVSPGLCAASTLLARHSGFEELPGFGVLGAAAGGVQAGRLRGIRHCRLDPGRKMTAGQQGHRIRHRNRGRRAGDHSGLPSQSTYSPDES
ncbi:hypothetical protein SSPIM334S_08518 [Streptomyces spiroverticillatus]